MPTGAITEYIDVAQLALYGFWIFFAFLIYYLRSEDKREGYPLESDRSGQISVVGFPPMPKPKVYKLLHGGTYSAPSTRPEPEVLAARPIAAWPGAPLEPTGDPMKDGVGPAAYAQRADHPELTLHGEARIVPMRVATDFSIEENDPDPRGMEVVGADGEAGGSVSDVWVDRSEPQARYLEVALSGDNESRHVLLPITLAGIDAKQRRVRVQSVLGAHFAGVPTTQSPDQVTQLEEDKICAYYGGGHLYAEPARQESLL